MSNSFRWGVIGSSQRRIRDILGATLHRWYDGEFFDPAGAPGGYFRWTDIGPNGYHGDAIAGPQPVGGALVGGKPAIEFPSDVQDAYITSLETLEQCRIYHDGTVRVVHWVVEEAASTSSRDLGGTAQPSPTTTGSLFTRAGAQGIRSGNTIQNGVATYLTASPPGTATLERALHVFDFNGPGATLTVADFGATQKAGPAIDNTPTGSPAAGDPSSRFEIGRRPGSSGGAVEYLGNIATWLTAVNPSNAQVAAVSNIIQTKYTLLK